MNKNVKEKVVHKANYTEKLGEKITTPSRNELFIHVISSSKLGLLNSPMIFL